MSKEPAATAPGLTRHLQALGIAVVEVDRPNRQRRRRSGKSDTHDAVSAARAAFAGDALGEAEDSRRQRRSDPGAAPGPQQRQTGPNPGAEPDASVDHDRTRRAPLPAAGLDHPAIGAHRRRVPSRGTHRCHRTRIVSRSRLSLDASLELDDRDRHARRAPHTTRRRRPPPR